LSCSIAFDLSCFVICFNLLSLVSADSLRITSAV
jgi:hypothetical protein